MADERKKAAKEFVKIWKDRGSEKSDAQSFWIALLRDVYDIPHPEQVIFFEEEVLVEHTNYIDGMIPSTRVLIEQKSKNKDLGEPIIQSDGSSLTPLQQANRYIWHLPVSKHPFYLVLCNFSEFWVYDMDNPGSEPEIILLKDLPDEYYRLEFLVEKKNDHLKREEKVSKRAGDVVAQLYEAFAKQYDDPDTEHNRHSLNVLCVRLVFCFYAENSGVFGRYGMFRSYMSMFDRRGLRQALIDLFDILDQPEEERDRYKMADNPELDAFPYVNGGLFSEKNITIPNLTDEIRSLLIDQASAKFNWSEISPTIFGAMFESTLNPDTRRSGGMHYTSVSDIHKVIDPLFLDDFRKEFKKIRALRDPNKKTDRLKEFQKKLASITILDPACGSGNFLTEAYLSLRRLENDVLKVRSSKQMYLTDPTVKEWNEIQVSLSQFYGIEINDFAVSVAKTALWIAESQMMKETQEIVNIEQDFLPLKSYTNIVQGNALRLDWKEIVPKDKLTYIIGNPPFRGYSKQSSEQKSEIRELYTDEEGKEYRNAGKIDYVAGWYFKAAQFMAGTSIRTSFVSTNSITQGMQAAAVWKPLYERFGVHIDFAYQPFQWNNEAKEKAQVFIVIVGFSTSENSAPRKICVGEKWTEAKNINTYLIDGPDVFVESKSDGPLCDVPVMQSGGKPVDGDFLIFSEEAKDDFIKKEPKSAQYFRQYLGSHDFLNGYKRYCLWLVGVSPHELNSMPNVMKQIECVKQSRLKSPKPDTRKHASTPALFVEIKQPKGNFLVVPEVSGESREYIPFGYAKEGIICSNKVRFVTNASLYHFGVLISSVHMEWMRNIGGRLGASYSYSIDIVYNDFPWPSPTRKQKEKICQTAQGILDARSHYPDSSLAEMYKDGIMPKELQDAHALNDRAVMDAYGFTKSKKQSTSEIARVDKLLLMYQQMSENVEA